MARPCSSTPARILRDSALAEDAVQDGFIRFWRRRRAARDPVPLLYAAVRSAALDLLRSRRRRRRREHAASRPEPWFDTAADQSARADLVARVLHDLPPEQREAVVLKIWAGLTFAQCAAAAGESANTMASRYRYALEKIAARLAAEAAP